MKNPERIEQKHDGHPFLVSFPNGDGNGERGHEIYRISVLLFNMTGIN
jgi:hypothetical protein